MPISNYGAAIHQAQVDQLTATISGVVNKPEFSAADWLAQITHCGQVIEMIKAGASDAEISEKHPGWTGDALAICHKIVDGTLSQPNDTPITEEKMKQEKKNQKKKEKKREAAYRRHYGKNSKMR